MQSPGLITSAPVGDAAISFGNFRLDPARRLLSTGGEPVRIGSRALDVLIALIDRAGEVVSQHELISLVWQGVAVEEAGVRVHIASLRRILGDGLDGARYIVNIAGRGYSFVAPVEHHRGDAPSSPASVPRLKHQLPLTPSLFVGRDEIVVSLGSLLLEQRFISIVGAGGIGKTTVAAAIVRRLRIEFGDENVAFVDLGAVLEPDSVPGAVISAVGLTLGGVDPVAELLSFVSDKRLLIVLDSCEHLLNAASLLASKLFQHARNIHLLVTSRESLRVEGETVHLLGPLACPVDETPTAAEAMATPAVQLFMGRASFSGFVGTLSDADAPVVSDICRRADGIALAIELVASRVGTYGISGVANLLTNSSELSMVGRRNVAPRHRTLHAMLDWSFELLPEDEQRLLSRLSMLVGLFTMEAACSVAGEVGDDAAATAAIVRLVDKSLVWVQPVGATLFYRLPDTTRAYAAAKLEKIEDIEPVARRHALHFAAFFRMIALEYSAQVDIRRCAPHIGNVRKALEWSFSRNENRAIGIELAADAAPLFFGLWLLVECRHWSQSALSALEDFSELSHCEARLQEAFAVSSMHTRGNTPEVGKAIRRGLELYEAEKQALPQLRLLAGLNLFLTRLADFEGALVAAKRCRTIAELSESVSDHIIAEWMLAAAQHLAGDQIAAVDHCERGFELEKTIGRLEINLFGYDHHLRAEVALARSLWLRGSPERACSLALDAMQEAVKLSPPGNYCMAAVYSLPVLLWSGNTDESAEHIERTIAQAEKHSLGGLAAASYALKAERLVMIGEPAAGVEALRQAIRLCREQIYIAIPAASRALAEGLSRCERHREARTTIEAAISSAREMGPNFYLPDLLRTQSEVILKEPCPDFGVAESALREAIVLASKQGAIGWELKAAIPLANLLIEQRRGEEAVALITPIYEAHVEKRGSKDLVEAARILAATQRPTER